MSCSCCQGDLQKVIDKRCACWIFHFSAKPWDDGEVECAHADSTLIEYHEKYLARKES